MTPARAGGARMAVALAGTVADSSVRQSRAAVRRLARRRGDGGAARSAYDPVSAEAAADPYPCYRELLRGPRLHYSAKRRVWILARHEEVHAAARAHDVLSSAEGVTFYRASIPMMLTSDRPLHERLRKMVAPDFRREAVERWRPAAETLASDAIETMLSDGETEAVSRLAAPLPVAMIASVLGVPAEDLPRFREWSDRIVEGFDLSRGGSIRTSAGVIATVMRLHTYMSEQFARRRVDPGDDLLSGLVGSSVGGALTEEELFWFVLLLLVAGNETTTNLLGTMLLSFADNPHQYERVREDPELIGPAVEEALRHTAPIQGMYRSALDDYRVGDATIPRGGRVLLLFGAANRDPRRYPDPDAFDVSRNPGDHLGFGTGIHFCLGAHLARLEAIVVLEQLAGRVRAIERAGEYGWRENPSLRGLARLPLRLR
jgi:beta-dihydromenaquinone-9 omega-hydroxylase